MYVYVITNSVNGKVYVGKSVMPATRWHDHKLLAARGKPSPLYDAIREHGPESFEFTVVEQCVSESESYKVEKQWIERLNSTVAGGGYNQLSGGPGKQRGPHSNRMYRHITPAMCGELYQQGLTGPEIAERLGVGHVNPIYQLLRIGGYEIRNAGRARKPAVTAEACWELYSSGLSLVDVGKRLDCSNQQVRRVLMAAGHRLRNASESHLRVVRDRT